MRLAVIVALCLLPAAAMAEEPKSLPVITDGLKQGEVAVFMVPIREWRIFPSLEPYRSTTVPVHLYFAANRQDDGGGYGGFGGSGYNSHGQGGPDGFGLGTTAVSRMRSEGGANSGGVAAHGCGCQNSAGRMSGPV